MFKSLVERGYKIEKMIGSGNEGEVWKCLKDGKEYAIKMIWKKNINSEAYFVKNYRIDFPFLVTYFDTFKEENQSFVVMEFCDDGDLSTLLKFGDEKEKPIKLDLSTIVKYLIEVILGLYELHKHGILHRDIKLSNVLMKGGIAKLGDFGISRSVSSTIQASTFIGTIACMAPEIHNGEKYNFPADVWSLGVLAYQLCSLRLPFVGSSITKTQESIVKEPYKPLSTKDAPVELQRVIYSMLEKDPSKRCTLPTLLKDPYLLQYANEHHLLEFYPQTVLLEIHTKKKTEKVAAGKEGHTRDGLDSVVPKTSSSASTPKSISGSIFASTFASSPLSSISLSTIPSLLTSSFLSPLSSLHRGMMEAGKEGNINNLEEELNTERELVENLKWQVKEVQIVREGATAREAAKEKKKKKKRLRRKVRIKTLKMELNAERERVMHLKEEMKEMQISYEEVVRREAAKKKKEKKKNKKKKANIKTLKMQLFAEREMVIRLKEKMKETQISREKAARRDAAKEKKEKEEVLERKARIKTLEKQLKAERVKVKYLEDVVKERNAFFHSLLAPFRVISNLFMNEKK